MNHEKNWLTAVSETTSFLQQYLSSKPATAVVLGTGLGNFIGEMEVQHTIPYAEIPHFPLATVEFHKGNLLIGHIGEAQVIAMQGRFHYYEGYSMQQITFPIRVLKQLGATSLLLSNAAGGLKKRFKKGEMVILTDHINLLPDNPLRGQNNPGFGPRFPDMSAPYSKQLSMALLKAAEGLDMRMDTGVYAAVMGPNLETRAEYKFLKKAGASMVGMSTVPEVIVANQVGLPCAAVSVITDLCDPRNLQPVSIDEIIAVAGQADAKLSQIFAKTIRSL